MVFPFVEGKVGGRRCRPSDFISASVTVASRETKSHHGGGSQGQAGMRGNLIEERDYRKYGRRLT